MLLIDCIPSVYAFFREILEGGNSASIEQIKIGLFLTPFSRELRRDGTMSNHETLKLRTNEIVSFFNQKMDRRS